MRETVRESSRRRARTAVTLVGGALALSGVAALGLAAVGQEAPPPRPPAERARAASVAPPPTRDTGGAVRQPASGPRGLDWARPVRVVIPELDVSSSFEEIGLDADGVMEVPQDPALAGWFTPAPPPGVAGVSVIAGHVTWDREPAVFFRLGDLRAGDRVEVERADGITTVFRVHRIGEFAKDSFPTRQVYRQVDGAELRLITCGGVYDEASNRYLSNVIVWARMVSHHRT